MRYVIIPEGGLESFFSETAPPFSGHGRIWTMADDLSLGGFFYDSILCSNNAVVGIRYWLGGANDLSGHAVFSRFKGDSRLRFDAEGCFVDIVFDRKNVADFVGGKFKIGADQDFGGDGVVRADNLYGLLFELD